MIINTQERRGGSQTGEFKLLETDVYRAKIAEAKIEEDRFGTPLNDGSLPLKLVVRWEVCEATEDQDDEVIGCAVWQRFNPWYGVTRDGKPSVFKTFVDALREQGLLKTFNPSAFDSGDLDGIEQRISVEKYLKSMGPNAGQPGNKVTAVLPLRAKKAPKNQPVEIAEADLP